MKIKNLLLGITIVFTLILAASFYLLSYKEPKTIDIVEINHVVKTIEEIFQVEKEDIKRSGTIKNIPYHLILNKDSDYTQIMNEAVENNYLILDFKEQEKNIGKIIFTGNHLAQKQLRNQLIKTCILIISMVYVILVTCILYIYREIMKPFKDMQHFAKSVAEGDLDFRLDMKKNNYFGAFTESFDLMREELKRARQAEYDANKSKKELVAQLSHDIKTPVSTIKAICELMQVKLENHSQRNELLDFSSDKMQIIYHKADTIDKLVSNLFHATLEELEMLKIVSKEVDSKIVQEILMEMNHYNKIHLQNKLPACLIYCDTLRLSQVIDNVISNSYKYANTDIFVEFHMDLTNKLLKLKIKDQGDGVSEDELPLIAQKYYRGKEDNVKNSSGSGLGMYLAKLFIEGMEGSFHYYNENGFVVEIGIKMV